MRESLGIALDGGSISTALVDADTPLLGSIDEFRHPWGEGGSVPPAAASARALASAADVAIERASCSHLHPNSIGVVCERADVRDLVPESFSSQAIGNVELVNSLDARLAYLRSVDALAGVSPILAFWPDGSETVIAAIDPIAGTIDSAHRYTSAELLSNSATFTATLDTIVAERDPVPKMLVAMGAPEQTRQMSAVASRIHLPRGTYPTRNRCRAGRCSTQHPHQCGAAGRRQRWGRRRCGGLDRRTASMDTTDVDFDVARTRRVADRHVVHSRSRQREHRDHRSIDHREQAVHHGRRTPTRERKWRPPDRKRKRRRPRFIRVRLG